VLGIEARKGTLNFGADADFILLDADANVAATYIAGECVWAREDKI
jgi:N-acetylglucosamine-6-phosphate deacetylase